nr:MAG TPA: hypothetical protein [Bacteriophage sp.]
MLSEVNCTFIGNIGNYEKSFRMKWLFYIGIKGGGR